MDGLYPSGLRLDIISDPLVEAITRLHEKYVFDRFSVVAHSMGGLVTRSFVIKYLQNDPENLKKLAMVMTVNSPMGGVKSAATGVKYSPVIVPSWYDVEPNSAFIRKIHSWKWPADVPYYLVVSFLDDDAGDGVVSLTSQSLPSLQSESTRLYIYNNSHVGTLSDTRFLSDLNTILRKQLQE